MRRKLVKIVQVLLRSVGLEIHRTGRVPLVNYLAKIEKRLNKNRNQPDAISKPSHASVTFNGLNGAYPIKIELIKESLNQLGVRIGDHILIHSSFNSFYKGAKSSELAITENIPSSEKYADLLFEMFKELVGPQGVIMIPTDFVGDYIIADGKKNSFDLKSAKSNRGFLTENFRKREGFVRSSHPIYNCAIYGKGYEESLFNHKNYEYVMDRGTPWWEFTKNQGKIIFFGTNLDCNSLIHLPEYVEKDNYPRPVFFQRTHSFIISLLDGSTQPIRAHLHAIRWSAGTVTRFCSYLNKKYGIYKTMNVGTAPITVMSAQAQYDSLNSELKNGVCWYDAEFDSKYN